MHSWQAVNVGAASYVQVQKPAAGDTEEQQLATILGRAGCPGRQFVSGGKSAAGAVMAIGVGRMQESGAGAWQLPIQLPSSR